jgi:hypothetical protein
VQLFGGPGKLSLLHHRQKHFELSQVHIGDLKLTAISINISY